MEDFQATEEVFSPPKRTFSTSEHEIQITLFNFCFVGVPCFLLAHIELRVLKERLQREKILIFVTSRPCEQLDYA